MTLSYSPGTRGGMDDIMTRKLYYEDSHLAQFRSQVVSCEKCEKGWEVVLAATAFYPEGGGQAADTGKLGNANVLYTFERGEEVIHLCDAPLEGEVEGAIDWEKRFLRMQQHSGEHILSGILYRRYGTQNKGFHMGNESITIDLEVPIPEEDIPSLEAEANWAVWQNLPVKTWYPTPEELKTIPYRSKKELFGAIRIVEFPGYDICACCGTHVKFTGEVGPIKIFSTVSFRGGTRMEMACGKQAMDALNMAYAQNKLVSQAFSAKLNETGAAAHRMNEVAAQQKYRLVGLERRIFDAIAAAHAGEALALHFEENLDGTALRELSDRMADVCQVAAVFSGADGEGYAYAMVTRNGDLRPLGKEMNAALNGRGGGKPIFQQGRVQAAKAQIEAFFRKK